VVTSVQESILSRSLFLMMFLVQLPLSLARSLLPSLENQVNNCTLAE
jgi:hypothetical protein